MTHITLKHIARTYKNNGQHKEQVARFTLTGEIVKADNKPYYMGGDIGDLQVKSSKASICKGTDLRAHIANDGANRYGYVDDACKVMYILSKTEYIEFVEQFGYITKDSEKNGGAEKIRLKAESRKMIEWLMAL